MTLGVADRPICVACGLASQPDEIDRHAGWCHECWDLICVRWAGQGSKWRIVTPTGDRYHWHPMCPGVQQADRWWFTTAEDAFYGPSTPCRRCKWYPTVKFDHHTDRPVRGLAP